MTTVAKLIKQLDPYTNSNAVGVLDPGEKGLLEINRSDKDLGEMIEVRSDIFRREQGIYGARLSHETHHAVAHTVGFVAIPLHYNGETAGIRYLVTVTANLPDGIGGLQLDITAFESAAFDIFRPSALQQNYYYFNDGDYPNVAMRFDRKIMTGLQVHPGGLIRLYSQHNYAREISVTYITNMV